MTAVNQAVNDAWYKRYYRTRPAGRDDILGNPGVPMQFLAWDRSVIIALSRARISTSSTVLDVGCGGGQGLSLFLRLGFKPQNLHGLDIVKDRLGLAETLYPTVNWRQGDASRLPYASNSFDLVTASALFIQITDETLARQIAHEMFRVARDEGLMILTDWRYERDGMKALDAKRIKRLFPNARVEFQTSGSLVPQVGRFLSAKAPSLYFLVSALFPFLVGMKTTVLRKPPRKQTSV